MYWRFYALLNADFEMLKIIEDKAFKEAMRLQVLMISGVEDVYDNLNRRWGDFEKTIDIEMNRIDLMNRILSNPGELSTTTPNAQGILLYQMTRHGKLTDAMPQIRAGTRNCLPTARKRCCRFAGRRRPGATSRTWYSTWPRMVAKATSPPTTTLFWSS